MKRIQFIDVLRGLAIFFMVINHAGHFLTVRPILDWTYLAIYLTVTIAAPLFLFLAGFSLVLSNKNFSYYLKRGLVLILLGLLINICFNLSEPFYRGRILFTIGLSIILAYPFLVASVNKYFSMWLVPLALIGLASFSFVYPYLPTVAGLHPFIANLFFIEFPIYPWFFLVLLGISAGQSYLRLQGEKQQYLTHIWGVSGLFGLIAWLVLTVIVHPSTPLSFSNDLVLNSCWNPSLITWFFVLGAIYFFLSLVYWLSEKKIVIFEPLQIIGRHSLVLYFLQFFIIFTIGHLVLGTNIASETAFSFAIALIMVLVFLCAWLLELNRLRRKKYDH
jgi:uncharacterized membrane protein